MENIRKYQTEVAELERFNRRLEGAAEGVSDLQGKAGELTQSQ